MMKRIIIQGSSMEPALFEGETYYAERVKHLRNPVLKEGDIVVAVIGKETVVKRIAKIHLSPTGARYYDLKGDNKQCTKSFECVSIWEIEYIVRGPTLSTRLMRRWRRNVETKEKE